MGLVLASPVCAQDLPSVSEDGTTITGGLSFAGWGRTADPIFGAIKFTGLSPEAAKITGSLSFNGVPVPKADIEGSLTFMGLAAPTDEISGELAFQGIPLPETDIEGSLTFVGCRALPEPEPIITAPRSLPAPQDPSMGLNIALEGNYLVKWGNHETDHGFVTLTKGGQVGPVPSPDGPDGPVQWTGFYRESDGEWEAKYWIPASGSVPSNYSGSESVEMRADGVVLIEQGYRWNWGMASSLIGVQDRLVGEWEYGDESGYEIWDRVPISLSHVTSTTDNGIESQPVGTPITLTSKYKNPELTARGLRDFVTLNLYGTGLWGRHYYWLEKTSGLELGSASYLCANPTLGNVSHSNDYYCFQQGGIIGMTFKFYVWSEARTGPQTLYFDDRQIPFNLAITDTPEPETFCDIPQ